MVVAAFICDVVRALGTVNSSCSVTVRGSPSLVAQEIDHFRYFVLFPKASEPSWNINISRLVYYTAISILLDHQLPIAAGE